MYGLQIGNPEILKIVYQFKVIHIFSVEVLIHKNFKGSIVRGEWFRFNTQEIQQTVIPFIHEANKLTIEADKEKSKPYTLYVFEHNDGTLRKVISLKMFARKECLDYEKLFKASTDKSYRVGGWILREIYHKLK